MKRKLCVIFCLLLLLSCQKNPQTISLEEGKWNSQVREALNELMASSGEGSYAVFDFDQTSIVHDISQALWVYQIEHLRYADAPLHHFLDGISTPEDQMPGTAITYS